MERSEIRDSRGWKDCSRIALRSIRATLCERPSLVLQSHFAMTPFAEIADSFDAIGIAQDLQSCSNLFITDRQGTLLAALHG